MAIFRLTGDAVAARLGGKATIVAGAALVVAGLAEAIAAPSWAIATMGFALIGAGAVNMVPVAFSAASRVPGMSANLSIAAVTTMGYAGFLATPPILGVVANSFGLSAALALVALMGVAIALVAVTTWRR